MISVYLLLDFRVPSASPRNGGFPPKALFHSRVLHPPPAAGASRPFQVPAMYPRSRRCAMDLRRHGGNALLRFSPLPCPAEGGLTCMAWSSHVPLSRPARPDAIPFCRKGRTETGRARSGLRFALENLHPYSPRVVFSGKTLPYPSLSVLCPLL